MERGSLILTLVSSVKGMHPSLSIMLGSSPLLYVFLVDECMIKTRRHHVIICENGTFMRVCKLVFNMIEIVKHVNHVNGRSKIIIREDSEYSGTYLSSLFIKKLYQASSLPLYHSSYFLVEEATYLEITSSSMKFFKR